MGSPVPIPPEIGGPCERCDGILWTPGHTPRWLQASPSNIFMCPGSPAPMPSGLYVLQQDPLNPCQYGSAYEPWAFGCIFYADRTLFYIQHQSWPMKYAFFHFGIDNPCELLFTNDQTDCDLPAIGKGGHVSCTFI